jgi:hypothetical protein
MVTQPRRVKDLYLAYLKGAATWEEVLDLLEKRIAERELEERRSEGGTAS